MITKVKEENPINLFRTKYTYTFYLSTDLENLVEYEKAWSNGRNLENMIYTIKSEFEHHLKMKMGLIKEDFETLREERLLLKKLVHNSPEKYAHFQPRIDEIKNYINNQEHENSVFRPSNR